MPDTPARMPRLGWALGGILALLAALRLARWLGGGINHDSAICGLMSLDLLEGRPPLFFWGQDYMGAADAYLSAPFHALWGPSPLVLNLLPLLLSLALPVVLYRTLRRWFPGTPALCALLLLAAPPATLLYFAAHAVTHYQLGLLLSALLMGLTMTMVRRGGGAWPWALWGLLAGLGLWTNFATVTVTAPGLALLLWERRRELGPARLLALLAGGLLGALPLVAYNLAHGLPHAGQGGLLGWRYLWLNLGPLWRNAVPIVLGVNTPAAGGGTWGDWLWLGPLGLAALSGLGVLAWRGRRREERALWLPLAALLLNLALVWGSDYGRKLVKPDQNYLLWTYLGLAFAWAALAQTLGRLRPWLPWALAAALVAGQLAAYPAFRGGALFCWPWDARVAEYRERAEFMAQARQAGLHHLYARIDPGPPASRENYFASVYAYLAAGDPGVANPWRERRSFAATAVDAATDPGFLLPLAGGVRFLGLEHQTWAGVARHGFAAPEGVARRLEPVAWRGRDLAGAELGDALWDDDLASGRDWPAAAGQGLELDLGAEALVGGVALVPRVFSQIPAGWRLEGAGADRHFAVLREAPDYWGPLYVSGPHPFLKARYPRSESYFAPRPLRYLRLTALGAPRAWSLAEVVLWGPDATTEPKPDWPASADRLVALCRELGPRQVYADAWPAARLAVALGPEVWTLPANLQTDPYGGQTPPATEPLALEAGPDVGVVLERRELDRGQAALERAGWRVERHLAGAYGLLLITGAARGPELPLAGVEASHQPEVAPALLEGGGGRWGSGEPQRRGMSLTLTLAAPGRPGWVELAQPDYPADYPRGLAALVDDSAGGWTATPLEPVGPLAFSGLGVCRLPGARALYRLPRAPATGRLRLELAADHPVWWWSVQGVRVWAARP